MNVNAEASKPSAPKRLTLQERLAQAAKAKKKKAEAKEALGHPELTVEANASTLADPEPPTISPSPSSDSIVTHESPKRDSSVTRDSQETKLLSDEIKRLNNEITQLQSKLDGASWVQKQKDYESKISQLLEEGKALSSKELKLNEKLKNMASLNAKLEASLKDYGAKNEKIQLELSELEDVLKSHKFTSLNQLLASHSDTLSQLAAVTETLQQEREQNWETKYKEQQKLYEKEVASQKALRKEVEDAKVQLQMMQTQTQLEVESKDSLIQGLNHEIISIKDENSLEITRLESMIEHLRLERENDTPKEAEQNANEFKELQLRHVDLQAQYVSSQENWKLIETNLSTKIEALTVSMNTLKKAKTKSTEEIRRLQIGLDDSRRREEELVFKLNKASDELKLLENAVKVKDDEMSELQGKLSSLQSIFNNDRQQYEATIQDLTERLQESEDKELSRAFYAESFESSALADTTSERSQTSVPTGATRNMQLLNKMGSNVRRLEVELMNLREENALLTAQKEEMLLELVKKMDIERDMEKMTSDMNALKERYNELSRKEQTLLELIGEKLERVAELQADVQDLKDICRQQVQQLVSGFNAK